MKKQRIKNVFSVDARSQIKGKGGEADWLTSYADMITILLCFFMLFFNMSKNDASILDKIKMDLEKTFNIKISEDDKKSLAESIKAGQEVLSTQERFKQIAEKIENNSNWDKSKVHMDFSPKEMLITFSKDKFFESGSTVLVPKMEKTMADVAKTLVAQGNVLNIFVEGHSDSMPLFGRLKRRWQSNWELSSARAARIVRIFIEKGIKKDKLTAVGHGDSRPLVKEMDEQGHYIKENLIINRRIVIRLKEGVTP